MQTAGPAALAMRSAASGTPHDTDHEDYPLAVLPVNGRTLTLLPEAVRRAFLDRLEQTLQLLRAEHSTETSAASAAADGDRDASASIAASDESPTDASHANAAVLARACAACGGACCTAGGDHAFLRRDSVRRIRRSHPTSDDAALHATYASHIPERHYAGSCLFHGERGCALPRTLRSDLCNRYLCGDLGRLAAVLQASGGTTAFVGAADAEHLRRMVLIDADSSHVIAIP